MLELFTRDALELDMEFIGACVNLFHHLPFSYCFGDVISHYKLIVACLRADYSYMQINVGKYNTTTTNNNKACQYQTSWGRLELKPKRYRNQITILACG